MASTGLAWLTQQGGAFAASVQASDPGFISSLGLVSRQAVIGSALIIGAASFATLTAIILVRSRARLSAAETKARAEGAALRAEADRAVALLSSEPQVYVLWEAGRDEPDFIGDVSAITATPIPRRVLTFGSWLPPEQARNLEQAVATLRSRGEGFRMMTPTLAGRYVEAEGRAISGRAILRLKDVGGLERALAELRDAHQRLIADIEPVRMLLDAIPAPLWARDREGHIIWVNPAYAAAVSSPTSDDVLNRQVELLDRPAREEWQRAHAGGQQFALRTPVVIAGRRRLFDVLDLPSDRGSAGIGLDVTEVENMRDEIAQKVQAHNRTLDQLPTAVAVFGADQRVTFTNAAYRTLWDLDASFLDQNPTDGAILDKLRAARKLPEQLDFRQWRKQLHEAYRAVEPGEQLWHLPDGKTLRVVTTPDPGGGITYVFDDVTERLDLERRYDAVMRVQGETLENLSEALAVFGSDGRLRLFNAAFSRMWKITTAQLAGRPHIESVISWAAPLYRDAEWWGELRTAVTGLERRETLASRLERTDGAVLDCQTVPLPDGSTLVCFLDVTDTVNVERALRERNDALVAADDLKSDFVHHVSYELRTPLTNIIGFTHLLHDDTTGPLTGKQREYLGYISSSSGALLAIINDILDLASIDAGAMKLDVGAVDVRKTIAAAAEGLQDRLNERSLRLEVLADENIGAFPADERRVRQILYNLLSNAIQFSPPNGTIRLVASRNNEQLALTVEDHGKGIPAEQLERVFNRFETDSRGSPHRGAGLGLSIVRSFVELHGGRVDLTSVEGQGTTVTCIFPLKLRDAAE
ncbi:PAS domain-containing sensor histidine kinase [Variibacter gotjawalensis]|nr:ATP-binding protein [Variibacter gotjawalensis]NIK47571.1 signal transduction histidine kinase [Variibacter gotjawalensis]